ncbi:hypothetical protein FOZ62_010963 [Perkinsus olseni]|uniref:Uncharacterized protein n=1 Tax=Perkinsus olseni TaxID=32597 RepID=A0A7J6S3T0_PEROL|nr:hypothetical protein FOZ62_010963 [Perkinsus olseni]
MSKQLDETLAGLDSIQPMQVLGKVYEAFLDTLRATSSKGGLQQDITKLIAAAESVLAPDEALAVAAMVQDHA